MKPLHLMIGSYAEPEASGLYLYVWNEDTQELERLAEADGLKNPTFLDVDAQAGILYAISEGKSEQGGKNGAAVSFRFDLEGPALTKISEAVTTDGPTCHIQRDPEGRHLIVVSYHGGMVGLMALEPGGEIGARLDQQQHAGHSVHEERQDRPHPHSSRFSPDGQYVFVQDLGLDIIRTYVIQDERLVAVKDNAIHPGAGPRHLAFHPDGKVAYVINEVDSTISVLAYDSENGSLTELNYIQTLPPGYEGENTCAEVAVSGDGRFVYGSNRGHDSIVVFQTSDEGRLLDVVQHIHTEGNHPRHFALSPQGDLLFAANKDTNNIAVFRVHPESGRLDYTGRSFEVSQPVCVIPF